MPIERVETLIVGGGQAGLTMSHMLSQRGRPHLVLERGRIAERWRTQRWDGLRFQFPNWSVRLPDFPFRDVDPDASGNLRCLRSSSDKETFAKELLERANLLTDSSALRAFEAVARRLSFSRAAEDLNVTPGGLRGIRQSADSLRC
jgi:cation diffusion facilitator CzcD-associated flavoprotein CzcO